jgi:autotransporter-associated beta strand protein
MNRFALRCFVAGLLSALLVVTAGTAQAAFVTWDADGATAGQADGAGAWLGTGLWWNGFANVDWASGDDATFGVGGTGGAVTLASPTTLNSLTFNSFSDTYTLGTAGQAIALNNGITMNSGAGAVSIISPVTLGTGQTWLNGSTSLLTVSGDVANGTNLLTIDGTGNTTLSGILGNGSGGLTKSGAGTLILSGANTHTGTTTISAGTLSVGVTANLGAAASNLVFDGGRLQITGTTLTNFSGIGHTVSFSTGKTVGLDINNAANTFTVDQALNQGTGGFTKAGAGTVILASANTYTGATTIGAGTIKLGNTSAISTSASVTVNSGGTLDINGVTASVLQVLGSGTVTNTGGAATLTINGNGHTCPAVFTGANLSLTIAKSGQTFTLTGNSTYGGATRIGLPSHPTTVKLGVNNALPIGGAVTVDASNVAKLDLNGFDQTVGSLSLGSNNGTNQGIVTGSGTSKLTVTGGG